MVQADVFCYLDNVQYKKNEWQNRNRIKTAQGLQWVTVPVSYRFPEKINAVCIDNRTEWGRKHINALRTSYGRCPFFDTYIGFFEEAYTKKWEYLSELNVFLSEALRDVLGIPLDAAVRASEMSLLCDAPTGRLIDICRRLGADTYLAGRNGKNYMDMNQFEEAGIRVLFQNFSHPVYEQRFGKFLPNLSVVDLLFNCGPESLQIIKNRI